MALVLVKEDGSGKADANTYALAADGDAYHDGHLYASAWTAAATGSKEKALAMATRIIDALFRFNGFKRMATQALQWPRRECRDPDAENGIVPGLLLIRGPFLDETKVPALVVQATCELARELLEADRTDNPMGGGLRSIRIEGALKIDFDPKDKQPPVTRLVQSILEKFGEYRGHGSGMARLVRS
jgi:hypothetical protein